MRSLAGATSGDLDDLVQVAAEKVFTSISRFDGKSELSTWIYGVCYHVLLNHRRWYRRWQLRFSYAETLDHYVTDALTAPELLAARSRARQVHRLLARLSEKYRAVVVLHDLEELEVSEIATIVGANELTVRSRLRDGRKQLSKLLQSEGALETGGAHEPEPSR